MWRIFFRGNSHNIIHICNCREPLRNLYAALNLIPKDAPAGSGRPGEHLQFILRRKHLRNSVANFIRLLRVRSAQFRQKLPLPTTPPGTRNFPTLSYKTQFTLTQRIVTRIRPLLLPHKRYCLILKPPRPHQFHRLVKVRAGTPKKQQSILLTHTLHIKQLQLPQRLRAVMRLCSPRRARRAVLRLPLVIPRRVRI